MIIAPLPLDTCGKLPDTFVFFSYSELSGMPTHTFDIAHVWKDARFSLHNFIVCIPEEGVAWEWGILQESHVAVNFVGVTNLLVG